jgi:hypothetical protein
VIASVILAGSRSDALICDCGEEVVRLYTFELAPGNTYYNIDGHLFELDYTSAEHSPVVRAEPVEGGTKGFDLITTCKPVVGPFEFKAHAACNTCDAKCFHFRVDGDRLIAQD